jgi:peptide chain release factor subunit 1
MCADSIEMWRMKKMVDSLDKAQGNGTAMISMLVPPDCQIARVNQLITKELGAAKCIKSRVNRNAVIDALVSIQHRIKHFNKPPANGLAIFCGTVVRENKERKELTLFEPVKPLGRFSYLCDSSFHTDPLRAMLNDHDKFGFIVIDGNGTLFASLQGDTVEILHRYSTTLPKKHKKGGQSAPRFNRLRF